MPEDSPSKQVYKKKVEVINSCSTPEARAARVKRLRNLANLSRKEMCDDDGLNVNTLKGWEIARYGGLPVDGAHKIIRRVSREGVFCTAEWLLYEEGSPPSVNISKESHVENGVDKQQHEQDKIKAEIELFQQHYSITMQCQIADDGMSTFYDEGDFVAGVKYLGENVSNLFGKNCIIQLAAGEIICRKLAEGQAEHRFNLLCTNPNTNVSLPIIFDAEVISIAPIIWHRKSGKEDI